MLRIPVVQGSDQRKPMRLPGHTREEVRDPNSGDVRGYGPVRTADLGRGIRLHVPGVELRRSALEEEIDAVFGRSARLERDHIGEGEPDGCERACVQKVAASYSFTDRYPLQSVQTEHRR